MRAIVKRFAAAAAVVVLIVATGVGYITYTRFWRYQARVDSIVAKTPPIPLSPEARQVFISIDGQAMPWIASKYLLFQIAPQRVPMAEWHLRGAIWTVLLSKRLSSDEIINLYCTAGAVPSVAKKLCKKPPSALARNEAVAVAAAVRIGASADPSSERYKRLVASFTHRVGAAN
jgi:hypothetical protein